jgi:Leucine-rich repeat (LRR) protein
MTVAKKAVVLIIERAVSNKESTLDHSFHQLTSVPPQIGQLTNLTELYLDNPSVGYTFLYYTTTY